MSTPDWVECSIYLESQLAEVGLGVILLEIRVGEQHSAFQHQDALDHREQATCGFEVT